MATFASRISDLTNAIATAVNARAPKVGASAYDIAVINGYTGTQAQWLLMQQGGMTSAQRTALTGSDLWNGRLVAETDTGITWRYNGTAWKAWESADWVNGGGLYQGINGAQYASPGWNSNYMQYRYVAGQVLSRGSIFLNGGSAVVNNQLILTMPVPYSSHSNSMHAGQVKGFDSSAGNAEYILAHSFGGNGGTNVWLGYAGTNGAAQATGASAPFVWAQSDSIAWEFLYDPA